jgi:cytoskeletal protein CcmA (bactofilin family)
MFNRVIRSITLLAAVLAVTLVIIAPANAADIRRGEKLVIPAGEVVNDDLYLFGSGITVDGTVNGDVIAFGDRIAISGPVNGRVNCAARDITVKGQVRDSVRVAASTVDIYGNVGGDLVAAASQVNIMPGGSVGREFLVAAGTVRVDGPVAKGILGSIGSLFINSSVGGDVDIECRALNLEPGASISGDLTYRSENVAAQAKEATVKGQVKQVVPPQPKPGPSAETMGPLIAGAATAIIGFILILMIILAVLKYIAALLTGIILILVARKYIPGLINTLKSSPWPCLGYGALFFFLAPVAIVMAFMLVIGIPLGLAGLALYILAVYLGHIFIGLFIGKWMLRQHTDRTQTGPLIGALALGLLVVYVIAVIPVIGCLSDLAAILFGLGAICLLIKTKMGGSAA